jgi:hypothetical protein
VKSRRAAASGSDDKDRLGDWHEEDNVNLSDAAVNGPVTRPAT